MIISQASPKANDAQHQTIGDAAFSTVSRYLEGETGIVLSEAKKGLAVSRLSRRIRALGLSDFDEYCDLLGSAGGPSELQEMILLLTTNVTRFFREPHHFEVLKTRILPELLAKAKTGGRVRIWSAGCSTGEEPYSVAMTLLDAEPSIEALDVRILATDIDDNVVQTGQAGRYRLSDQDRSAHASLVKHTQKVPGHDELYEVSPSAKALVQFGKLNLQHEWPMKGKFDVIFCRNVVIYFANETQQVLWPRFAKALNRGGHLMIGHSERVTGPATGLLTLSGVTQYQLRA